VLLEESLIQCHPGTHRHFDGAPYWNEKLLANAQRSLTFLQDNPNLGGATGRQAEVNFLIKALGG